MCEHLWGLSRDLLVGGWPYSEGIFEDLNKVLFAQFYWDPARPAEEIVKEYAAYEFAPAVAERIWQAALLLEQTLPRRREGDLEHRRYVLEHPEGAEAAFRLLEQAEGDLPAWARESWRWRVLWLRALADRELVTHDFAVTEACEAALEELTRIYHAEEAAGAVAPPTYRALRAARPE